MRMTKENVKACHKDDWKQRKGRKVMIICKKRLRHKEKQEKLVDS